MLSPQLAPEADAQRLTALHALELMDSRPETMFDHIAQLAAAVCNTSGAGIALIDDTRVWFKALVGVPSGVVEEPIVYSPCSQVVALGDLFELPDMQLDPCSMNSQLAVGMGGGRFFAATPLLSEQGLVLGAVFVVDSAARTVGLMRRQRERLKTLADHVVQLATERVRRYQLLRHLVTQGGRAVRAYREAPAILCVVDRDGYITEVSDRWLQAFGYRRDDSLGIQRGTLLTQASYDLLESAALREITRSASVDNVPLRLQREDGTILEMAWSASAERDRKGLVMRLHVVFTDITGHRQLENTMLLSHELAVVTLRSIGDGVISTDTQCRIQYLNPVAEAITGWTLGAATNRPLNEVFRIFNEFSREVVEDPVQRCLDEDCTVALAPNTVLLDRRGNEYAIEDTASPIRDLKGQVVGAVLVFHDVSEQRRLQREISHKSSHDAMTGLVNRAEFELQLQRALDEPSPPPTEHAVCYIDLDQFKMVNDTSGHAAGDELLRQLSALMRSKIRRNDVLARLGGDEFGLLLMNCGMRQATLIAENLRRTAEEFRFSWGSHVFKIGASVGLVPLSDPLCTVGTVMQAADQACYAAKDRGRNCVHVYLPQDEELVRRHGEIRQVAHIPSAIEENRFQLYAQQITPLHGERHKPLHFEILLRLKDSVGAMVMPGAFMPAAERYNRATVIDRWVVSSTLKWLSENAPVVKDLGLCAINLSGQSLGDKAFQQYVIEQIDNSRVANHKICFEVTETAAVSNLAAAARFMHALRERGCRLALDDFGSGLSSFGYLKNLPVDILKIDGMFVRGIVNDPVDKALVRSINEVGQLLGKETVAECVENEDIQEVLRRLGVNYAQGFNAGLPEPLGALTDRLMQGSVLAAVPTARQSEPCPVAASARSA